MNRIPYSILVAALLALATLPSLLLATIDGQQKEPIVTSVVTCKLVNPPPPDAKPNTATLDCGREFAWEIPEWYAAFKGDEFLIEILSNGTWRFPNKQPAGSEVRYAPPCPPKPTHPSYRDARGPLQQSPCNSELTPQ